MPFHIFLGIAIRSSCFAHMIIAGYGLRNNYFYFKFFIIESFRSINSTVKSMSIDRTEESFHQAPLQ